MDVVGLYFMGEAVYDFTNEQLERYSRHIILKSWHKGQKKLQSKVLIVGTEVWGTWVVSQQQGGTIGLVDFDVVDCLTFKGR